MMMEDQFQKAMPPLYQSVPDNARAARFAIYRRQDKDWMPDVGKPFNNAAVGDRFATDQTALNEGPQVAREHAIEPLVGFLNKRRRE